MQSAVSSQSSLLESSFHSLVPVFVLFQVSKMTIVATEDNRNLEWRKSNVGSTMLQKMGWKEGEGVGKRAKSNTTALRALKRQAGLGLGAKMESEGGSSESTNHFAKVLANLQVHHNTKTKKSKKSKLTLPQNKVTAGHAQKMRQAKFGEKSAEDLACIFGNRDFQPTDTTEKRKNKKRTANSEKNADSDSDANREKKRRKKEKKEKKLKKQSPPK